MENKKLTQLTEKSTITNDAVIHIAEPNDMTQGPAGSSYKFKLSALLNNVGRWIFYGFALDDGSYDSIDITAGDVAAYVNALPAPINITATQTPVVLEFQKGVLGGTQRYIFFFVKGKGLWGGVGAGGSSVAAGDFKRQPIVKVIWEDIANDPNTVTIDLGEIDPDNFLAVANDDEHDFTNDENIYYFTYTSEGVGYSMRFIGEPGIYGGGEATDFTDDDFVAGPTTETAPGLIPTLQQVNADGGGTTNPLTVKDPSGLPKLSHRKDKFVFSDGEGNETEYHTDPASEAPEKVIARMGDVIPITGTAEGNPVIGSVSIYNPAEDVTSAYGGEGISQDGLYYQLQNLAFGSAVRVVYPTAAALVELMFADVTGSQSYIFRNSGTVVVDSDLVFSKILHTDVVDSSTLTGTTTEFILSSYLIPANTGDGVLDLGAFFHKTSSGGVADLKIYLHTSVALGGPQIGYCSNAAGQRSCPFNRKYALKSGTIVGYNATASAASDSSTTNAAPMSVSYNAAIDNYIVVTGTLANSGDTFTQKFLELIFKKSV